MKAMQRKTKHIFIKVFILAGLMATGQQCQHPQDSTRIVKVGLTHGKNHSFTQALQIFADSLERQTGGRYEVKIFYGSQLGGEKEMQEMLALGSLEVSLSGIINTYEPLFSLFEMPYLYRDRQHVIEVNNGPVMQEVAKSLKSKGIQLLGFYENGYRNITNSVRPVHKPKDLRGLLIRTPENPAQIETVKALGAIPTPMSFSELYTALLQGVVDGQENPLQNIWYGRLYEAQRYITMTAHIYNSVYVLVSDRFWESLPAADKKIFRSCMQASSMWQLRYMENLDKELEEKMRDLGVEFIHPEKLAFQKAAEPAYEALYRELGDHAKEIVKKIREVE